MGKETGDASIEGGNKFYLGPILVGLAIALGVVAFYLGLHTLTTDWNNAQMQLREYRWWIAGLSVGLGVQAALFLFLKRRGRTGGAKSSLAASGGVSTASMAACCAHYVATFLPLLGLSFLSTAAAGLARYQNEFFLLGVISNIFGIGVMVRLMRRMKTT